MTSLYGYKRNILSKREHIFTNKDSVSAIKIEKSIEWDIGSHSVSFVNIVHFVAVTCVPLQLDRCLNIPLAKGPWAIFQLYSSF